MKFIGAKEALNLSNKNKERRVEYYLDNIENDRKVNKIKRDIEKAILNGEKECQTVFWKKPNNERRTAILKYFSDLGYDISSHNGIYYVDFVQLHPTPRL